MANAWSHTLFCSRFAVISLLTCGILQTSLATPGCERSDIPGLIFASLVANHRVHAPLPPSDTSATVTDLVVAHYVLAQLLETRFPHHRPQTDLLVRKLRETIIPENDQPEIRNRLFARLAAFGNIAEAQLFLDAILPLYQGSFSPLSVARRHSRILINWSLQNRLRLLRVGIRLGSVTQVTELVSFLECLETYWWDLSAEAFQIFLNRALNKPTQLNQIAQDLNSHLHRRHARRFEETVTLTRFSLPTGDSPLRSRQLTDTVDLAPRHRTRMVEVSTTENGDFQYYRHGPTWNTLYRPAPNAPEGDQRAFIVIAGEVLARRFRYRLLDDRTMIGPSPAHYNEVVQSINHHLPENEQILITRYLVSWNQGFPNREEYLRHFDEDGGLPVGDPEFRGHDEAFHGASGLIPPKEQRLARIQTSGLRGFLRHLRWRAPSLMRSRRVRVYFNHVMDLQMIALDVGTGNFCGYAPSIRVAERTMNHPRYLLNQLHHYGHRRLTWDGSSLSSYLYRMLNFSADANDPRFMTRNDILTPEQRYTFTALLNEYLALRRAAHPDEPYFDEDLERSPAEFMDAIRAHLTRIGNAAEMLDSP